MRLRLSQEIPSHLLFRVIGGAQIAVSSVIVFWWNLYGLDAPAKWVSPETAAITLAALAIPALFFVGGINILMRALREASNNSCERSA